jgi:hypothetical protein
MDRVEETAREIARDRGHRDPDAVIRTTDEGPVPVWRFYVENAERVVATTPVEPRVGGPASNDGRCRDRPRGSSSSQSNDPPAFDGFR